MLQSFALPSIFIKVKIIKKRYIYYYLKISFKILGYFFYENLGADSTCKFENVHFIHFYEIAKIDEEF